MITGGRSSVDGGVPAAADAVSPIRIFISYRRDDSRDFAGRIFESLDEHFGVGDEDDPRVFEDVYTIAPGRRYAEAIETALKVCDVFLLLIGPRWLTSKDEGTGKVRISDPTDVHRREIEAAIGREIPVFLVLMDGAQVPRRDQLPTESPQLQELPEIQVQEVAHRTFRHDIGRLIRYIEKAVGTPAVAKPTEPADTDREEQIAQMLSPAAASKEVQANLDSARATTGESKGERQAPVTDERVSGARPALSSTKAAVLDTAADVPAAVASATVVPTAQRVLPSVVPATVVSPEDRSEASQTLVAGGEATAARPEPAARAGGANRRRKWIIAVALVLCVGGAAIALGVTVLGSSGARHTTSPPSSPPAAALRVTRFRHDPAVAGRQFTAQLAVTRRGSSTPLAGATVACPARLGTRTFAGAPSFASGLAICRWALPSGGAKSRLTGKITVSSGRQSVSHDFAFVLTAPPERLVLVSGPIYQTPHAGGTFAATVRFALLDDRARRQPLVPAATHVVCRGQVASGSFTRGTSTVSPTGVTCSWPVPQQAAGRLLLLQITVKTSHGIRSVPVHARVAAAISPSPTPSPSPSAPSPPPSPTQTAPIPP